MTSDDRPATSGPMDGWRGRKVRLGYRYEVTLGKMLDAAKQAPDDALLLPYIRAANIQDSGLALEDVNSMPFTQGEAARLDLRSGDLLVVEGGAVGTVVRLDKDLPDWSFQKTVNRVRARSSGSTRLLAYVLRCYRDAGYFEMLCSGSTIAHLTAEKLAALAIPDLPVQEQDAIADFLDVQTARIDTLIGKQAKLITTLRERRGAVISDAVTAGPPTTRFGTAMRRIDDRKPGISLPLMSVSQTRGVVRRSELTDKPARADSLDEYKICQQGDIVFNKMSIRAGAMGVAREDGLVTYHYEVMRPIGEACADYIVYLMKSAWFTGELISRERGIGAGNTANVRTTEVPFSTLRTIAAYIPEPGEQRRISQTLDQQTNAIDALILRCERHIALAKERRAALIAATVTGQIDVRTAGRAAQGAA